MQLSWNVCNLLFRNQICNKNGSEVLLSILHASTKIIVWWLKCSSPGSHQKNISDTDTWPYSLSPQNAFMGKMLLLPFFLLGQDLCSLGKLVQTGKPWLFSCIPPINHLFFKNPASFSLFIDTWIVSSPSCPAVHWWIMAGASFRFLIFEIQLKMTWEGLAFKVQALNLAWNSYVLSDWAVTFIMASDRSGSWVSPGLKMNLTPLEPIATSSKHF